MKKKSSNYKKYCNLVAINKKITPSSTVINSVMLLKCIKKLCTLKYFTKVVISYTLFLQGQHQKTTGNKGNFHWKYF